jgi:hypothetical protein
LESYVDLTVVLDLFREQRASTPSLRVRLTKLRRTDQQTIITYRRLSNRSLADFYSVWPSSLLDSIYRYHNALSTIPPNNTVHDNMIPGLPRERILMVKNLKDMIICKFGYNMVWPHTETYKQLNFKRTLVIITLKLAASMSTTARSTTPSLPALSPMRPATRMAPVSTLVFRFSRARVMMGSSRRSRTSSTRLCPLRAPVRYRAKSGVTYSLIL